MKTLMLVRSLLILTFGCGCAIAQDVPNASKLKIGIIGDSTVCNYPAGSRQEGWGEELPSYFSADTTFLNTAEKGRSTKTFPAAHWKQILDFKPDYVLIQFGHNDSHEKSRPEATDAATDFRENLKRYIAEARASGIVAVLVTPVHRRTFDESGHLTTELEPYVTAMREVAKEVDTPLVDLYQASGVFFESLGEKASDTLTMNTVSNADQQGKPDRTHFTTKGAKAIAGLVATELAKVDPKLMAAVLPSMSASSSTPAIPPTNP
ncbi:Lysophospholipase L1 [Verrucomicrobium sp. GAS474]|uniref:rhamnogalacturonan acetylesterase n=1 Tax=Verrucomicrobium sp. GAS474 TaxID=1882831 RepID=UPI00087AFA2A|nr:rhamnogalacturonan acetylesterase [Verrucomicrobium sp. GAS474]SDU27707.1 Lysophospholipase L1 [Verrucomicrobium sp. GAS474]